MRHAARIIDANANRAREALRTLEDLARFALDHHALAGALKSLRHDLQSSLAALPLDQSLLLASRDTPNDVGTRFSTPSERARDSLAAVAAAAASRLTESLRVLEETVKTLPDAPSAAFESLRYRAYDAERSLRLALRPRPAPQWRLCVILTESLCTLPWERVAHDAILAGADCLQLREKGLSDRELLDRATRLVAIAREHPTPPVVIINDRVDIALLANADGAHLGHDDVHLHHARALAGDRLLLGLSASSITHARDALHLGADYCGVGAMFPTSTKRKDAIAGPSLLSDYLAHTPPLPPHLAIGGVTPERARELAALGCRGIAVCSAVCASNHPSAVAREFLEALSPAPTPPRASHAD